MAKLIFGCGYLGSRVARLWIEAGEQVFVVTRSGERAALLAQQGYTPIVADVLRPASLRGLPAAESVLFAVSHDRQSGASIQEVYVGGLQNVVAALSAPPNKFIYVSSTGVYAQSNGEWVDEDSPCEPERESARACLAAEQTLFSSPIGIRAVILRMAGLYGPGRIPNVADIRAGRAIAAPQNGFLNLIHLDDAARAVVAADRLARAPRTYVVSDGSPVERSAYYQELARLVGAPPPQFVAPSVDSPAAGRASTSKRARNSRMLAELGIRLDYPSYREGLAAITAVENLSRTGG
jgi:nucleoside-diphosphate-sugar epimerase